MSMYRSYGVQPLGSTSTPPQHAQRGPHGYTSPANSPFGGPQAGFQHSTSMQPPVASSSSHWNAPSSFAQGQMSANPVSATPQGPKQFSWGLPIANYTPKSAGDDAMHASPDSPRAMHGTPAGTPNRPQNPLYPMFDADDEAPPRESTMGFDDEDLVASPPSVVPATQPARHDQPAEPAQPSTYNIIVFGFSAASQQVVLQAFKAIGEVVDVQHGPHAGANWCTLVYRKQWDASLATRKSGEVIGGTMIGVKWADGSPLDSGGPLASGTAAATALQPDTQNAATHSNRPPPPLGQRVNVLSANEALKKPTTTGNAAPGVLARFTGVRPAAGSPGPAPPLSPHAALLREPATPNRGWSQAISNLVFGE